MRHIPLAFLLALAAAHSARAQVEQITGNTLTITCTTPTTTGTLIIPRSALVTFPFSLNGDWSSPTPIPITDPAGAQLGTVSGSLHFDTGYDNIIADLTFTAAGASTRFAVATADMGGSFGSGDDFFSSGHLFDLNNDGATYTGMFSGGRGVQNIWNNVARNTALPTFSVAPGADLTTSDTQNFPYSVVGTKSLRLDFSLTPSDSITLNIASITSIPAPAAASLLTACLLAAHRRRR